MDNNACIVTGPIGSGKTYVCKLLENYGFPVLDLDTVSNKFLHSEEGVYFLSKNFPNVLLHNKIQKDLLAEEVFSDKNKLLKLEEFLHQKVNDYLNSWIDDLEGYGFIEVSAPKTKSTEHKTIVLNTPIELRIRRLIGRGMDLEDINRRIGIQESEDWWNALGETINNIHADDVEEEVISLLREWGWLNE